jgi:hypothetical protein
MTMTQAVPQLKDMLHLPDRFEQAAAYADRLSERATAPIERILLLMSAELGVYAVADRINDAWHWRSFLADWHVPAKLKKHDSPEAAALYGLIKAQRKPLDKKDAIFFWQGVAAPTRHPQSLWAK